MSVSLESVFKNNNIGFEKFRNYSEATIPHLNQMKIRFDNLKIICLDIDINNKCKFIVEDVCFNLLIDNMYWVDTTKYHSAFNGNKDFDRYHIVGLTDELV